LKYKSPLATTARPDEASTGNRRNWTALLAMDAILQDVGGGESDMVVEPGDGGLFFLRSRTTLGSDMRYSIYKHRVVELRLLLTSSDCLSRKNRQLGLSERRNHDIL